MNRSRCLSLSFALVAALLWAGGIPGTEPTPLVVNVTAPE